MPAGPAAKISMDQLITLTAKEPRPETVGALLYKPEPD